MKQKNKCIFHFYCMFKLCRTKWIFPYFRTKRKIKRNWVCLYFLNILNRFFFVFISQQWCQEIFIVIFKLHSNSSVFIFFFIFFSIKSLQKTLNLYIIFFWKSNNLSFNFIFIMHIYTLNTNQCYSIFVQQLQFILFNSICILTIWKKYDFFSSIRYRNKFNWIENWKR